MTSIKTNPYKAVDYVESSVKAALERCGYLIADVKYDGVRGNICVDNTANGQFLSRVSKTIPALEYLNGYNVRWKMLLADDRCNWPDGFMLDGELMVKGVDFNTGSGLLRTKWTKTDNYMYHSFADSVPLKQTATGRTVVDGKHLFELDMERLKVVLYAVVPLDVIESGEDHKVMNLLMPEHVKSILPLLKDYFPEIEWCLSESHDVYDMTELNALYELKREEGHEGLVIKDPMDHYKRGKKTGWWKMKPECEADGIVTGLVWGTNGKANEGKVVGFEVLLESGRVVNATNISRALMDEFTARVKEYTTECNANEAGCWYMNPYEGWACQISYMEETPDGSLRHPSWTKWRGTEEDPTVKI